MSEKSELESLRAECARLEKERNTLHALMCVVELMDPNEGTNHVKVFRDSMPSLAHLFRASNERTLYLDEAVKRAMDSIAVRDIAVEAVGE
jgi:hypothetical protein